VREFLNGITIGDTRYLRSHLRMAGLRGHHPVIEPKSAIITTRIEQVVC
jgi:hypothetical protein